jgi:hypothetical protein
MRSAPTYIQQAGVLDLPAKFPWDGYGMHYGPSQGTKLHQALAKLTTRGLTTLAVLIEEWLLWRLHGIDRERFLHHGDAVLAWEIDKRYRDESSIKGSIPKTGANFEALRDGDWMLRQISDDDYWEYPGVKVHTGASLVSIVKQTLPTAQKKAFTTWLDWALQRAAKLDPGPKKNPGVIGDFESREAYRESLLPYFGNPMPREALDPEANYKPEQRDELLNRFLVGLDWKKNEFLRSPDEMKKLGFKGTPYKL